MDRRLLAGIYGAVAVAAAVTTALAAHLDQGMLPLSTEARQWLFFANVVLVAVTSQLERLRWGNGGGSGGGT